jgi:hypothetical protein
MFTSIRGSGIGASVGRLLAAATGTAAVAALLAGAGIAAKPPTILATFDTPGTYSWTVPSGVRSVTVDVFGAEGGSVVDDSVPPGILVSRGGFGGQARGSGPVSSGVTFQIVVGGRGENAHDQTSGAGGFNGGGDGTGGGYFSGSVEPDVLFYGGAGGGGASDVRIDTSGCALTLSCGLDDRIIVGGGGGGAGGHPTAAADGGSGGGTQGSAGEGVGGGGGGTQEAGGKCSIPSGSPDGGSFGQGGDAIGGAEGGGGGGWYGGGAGCTSSVVNPPGQGSVGQGSGGGGGSGFLPPPGKKITVTFPGGTSSGHGRVLISTP